MVRALEAGSPSITVSSVHKPWGPGPRAQKGQKVSVIRNGEGVEGRIPDTLPWMLFEW